MLRRPSIVPFVIVVSLLLAACSLPDLQPFASATSDLESAVAGAQRSISTSLGDASLDDQRARFDEAMAVRVDTMQAVVDYSNALAGIAAAGRRGQANAARAATAFNDFLGALPTGAAGFPAVAANVVSVAYGQVATVRAAGSLTDAVAAADPEIQRIAAILLSDLADLRTIVRAAAQEAALNIEVDDDNRTVLGNWQQLDERRRALESRMAAADTPDETSVAQLERVNRVVDSLRDRKQVIDAKLTTIEQRRDLQLHMLEEAEEGFTRWAQLHGQLAGALRQGLPLDVQGLLRASLAIRDAIEEVRTT